MHTRESYLIQWGTLLGAFALGLLWPRGADAAGFSEPPLVVYGKVFKYGQGGGYQLFSGTLHVQMVSNLDTARVFEWDIPLRKVGSNGEFSYRAEIDQETKPSDDKLATTLAVGAGRITYTIQSITVDGHPASLLDASQAAEVYTSFADRGKELRLDVKTQFEVPDSDGDSMPDWWEQLFGLDANDNRDAIADVDGDGWNNLKEFQLGTDPLVADFTPLLQDSLLVVTAGGTNGVYLSIVDADTSPANIKLKLLDGGTGLTWKRAGTALQVGDTFSCADLLAGGVSVDVAMEFQKDTVRIRLEDLTTPGVAAQEILVSLDAFSPSRRLATGPAVWLDAQRLGAVTAVQEWSDATATARDAYQPSSSARPRYDGQGRVIFAGNRFLYLDDRDLDLNKNFTAFVAFEPGAVSGSEQALFATSAVRVSQVPREGGALKMGLQILQGGRKIIGPTVASGGGSQFTMVNEGGVSNLEVADLGRFFSQVTSESLPASFATIGAARTLSASQADSFFSGSLREVLLFDRALSPTVRSLIQDYQRSRWESVRVWNYRTATVPLRLHGDASARNSLAGGEDADDIMGGDRDDILRGGPGNNRLTGGLGADRFCFVSGSNADVIADFSENQNDVIDLTEIFGGRTGSISQFISVKPIVTRISAAAPRVDTVLQLNHSGNGSAINQTITLEGVALGAADIPRLVGLGKLQTGIVRPLGSEMLLLLPGAPVVCEAESTQGTAVTLNVSASDPVDGLLTPVLNPPSGSTFPIGDTTVSVSVINSAGISKTGSILVRVVVNRPPSIVGQPQSQMVTLGSAVSFGGTVIGAPRTFQWLKNGASINGANGTDFELTSASMSSAGGYALFVSNRFGSNVSTEAQLGVVDVTAKSFRLGSGATAAFKIEAAGNGLSYLWKKNGGPLPTDPRINGRDTKALSIKNLQTSDDGVYTCTVTGPGGVITGGANTLNVIDQKPSIITPVAMPQAIMSGNYAFQIPVDPSQDRKPTSYSATGLPAGLQVNSDTGIISGKPSVSKTTPYAVTLTAANSKGSSSANAALFVNPLPASTVLGTFNGLIERSTDISAPVPMSVGQKMQGHGGQLKNLAIAVTGHFTGTIVLEDKSYSVPAGSRLDAVVGGNPSATVKLVRGTVADDIPDLIFGFSINKDTGALSGSISDGLTPNPVNVNAWRQKAPVAGFVGIYTAVLALDQALVGTDPNSTASGSAENMSYPQGSGYLTMTVGTTGSVDWSGRLADGTAISGSSSIGPQGDVPFYQILYTPTAAATAGSICGWMKVVEDTAITPVNGGRALLDGNVDWLKKPQSDNSTTRSYKGGFPLHNLAVIGGRYVTPPTGQAVLGLVDSGAGTTNAHIDFTEGGLRGPAPVVGAVMANAVSHIPLRISKKNAITMPVSTANPAGVILSINASAGLMNGSFTLKNDPDPTDATPPIALLTRTANYTGVLVPRLRMGVGQFQLAELPSQQGTVKNTLSTSALWSGQVIFK